MSFAMTLMLYVAGAARLWPLALMAVTVGPVLSASEKPGNVGDESLAAVLMMLSATPGDPVMYWFAPLLPADVMTMTPAFAALVDATEDGSSFVPNADPSDMLMTSMPLSTAHSMASTVTSVEPRQPNTRTPYRCARGATPGPIRNLPGVNVDGS